MFVKCGKILSLVLGVIVLSSCGMNPKYVIENEETLAKTREAWKDRKDFPKLNKLDYQIPVYARYMKGIKVCLDPGHGGDQNMKRYKRGPTDYREAIMNFKVANYLKEFLEESGAIVKLTREGDYEISLADRVKLANEWGADLFLSIHHNAATPTVNRTTTWFHFDPDFQPANVDFARYIQHGVADALRLPQIDGVPLKSDQLMYDTGFGVLRGLNMVACLCEASFFTHPYEEYRLKKDNYLKREAYGHYLGFARYIWGGIPKAYLSNPEEGGSVHTKTPTLELFANTGFRTRKYSGSDKHWIFSDSVTATVDGKKLPATFNKEKGIIEVKVEEPLTTGEHVVMGGFRNYNGNYSHPLEQKFIVDPPVNKIIVSASDESVIKNSTVGISINVIDEDGEPVLDGTIVYLGVNKGSVKNDTLKTKDGMAYTDYLASDMPKEIRIIAVSEGRFGSSKINVIE